MRSIIGFTALAAIALSASVQADELLLTDSGSAAKRGAATSTAIDYMSDGTASGLQIELTVPKGGAVDVSRFGTNLPKGFSVMTNVVDGKLIALVVTDTNQTLPAGLVSLGVVSSKGGSGSFALQQIIAADPTGKSVAVKTTATDASK